MVNNQDSRDETGMRAERPGDRGASGVPEHRIEPTQFALEDGFGEGGDHGRQDSGRGPSPKTVNRAIVAGAVFTAAGVVISLITLLVH